jgi:hypothetical protein
MGQKKGETEKSKNRMHFMLVYWGGRNSRCGGGVGGVRSWPDPGGRCTRTPDPGPDILQQGAGKRSGRSGPDWMGGPH